MNETSISSDELASSLQRSAGVLATLGTTIEEASALTVAANSILQDPDSVAAGLRTIQLRMVGTKESKDELQALGEDVDDFVVQTQSKLRESILNLTAVASNAYKGFDILDENGNYKGFYDMMLGLSEIYAEIQEQDKKLGNNSATALIELIAGKNRSAIASAILSDPELLKDAYSKAMDAEGSAAEELEKQLDTIQAKWNILLSDLQELAHVTLSSDFIKDVVDMLSKAVELVTKLIDNVGVLPTVATIGSGILGFKGEKFTDIDILTPFRKVKSLFEKEYSSFDITFFEEFNKELEKGPVNAELLAEKLGQVSTNAIKVANNAEMSALNIGKLTSQTKLATIATKGLALAQNLLISAVIVGTIYLAKKAWDHFNVTVAETQQAIDSTTSRIKELQSEFDTLSKKQSLTVEEKERLDYLKERLEYEERLLEIQKSQNVKEQIGKPWKLSDTLDENTYTYKVGKEFTDWKGSTDHTGEFGKLIDKTSKSLIDYKARLEQIVNLEKDVAEGIGGKKTKAELAFAKKERDEIKEELKGEYEELFLKYGNYSNEVKNLRDIVKNAGAYGLTKEEYDYANNALTLYQNGLEDVKNEINEIAQITGNYSWLVGTSIEKINARTTADLSQTLTENFTDEELDFLATLSFDKDATIDDLKKVLSIAQKVAEAQSIEVKIATKSDMIDTISDLSDGFDILDDIYADVFDKGSFDFAKLSKKKFEEAFKDLTPEYENFIETVASYPDDLNKCQSAFNELTSAYIKQSGVLDNLNENNKKVAISYLELMGVSNAEEVITNELTAKEKLAAYEADNLTQMTYGEAQAFINASNASEEVKRALAQLALEKIHLNGIKINTQDEITQLINLGRTAGATAKQLADLSQAQSILKYGTDYRYITKEQREWALGVLDDINNGNYFKFEPTVFNPQVSFQYSGADKTKDAREKALKDARNEFDETIDYIEKRLGELSKSAEYLTNSLENVFGSVAKNKLDDARIDILGEKINTYTQALDVYQKKADEVLNKIPEGMREAVKNGAIYLQDLTGDSGKELKELVDKYNGWADKVWSCKDGISSLKEEMRDLELEKFQNIVQQFTDQFNVFNDSIELMNKQISLIEESGNLVGKSFYEAQKQLSEKQLKTLEGQQKALVNQLTSAVSSKRVKLCPVA